MHICYLNDCPEYIDEMAELFHAEWSWLIPGKSVADVTEMLRERAKSRTDLPFSLVATKKGNWLGSASLKAHDMETNTDLTPWLAAVYVKAPFRGQGIARLLIAKIQQKASDLGFSAIYLYTPDATRYYEQLGWVPVKREIYRGYSVTIMKHTL